MLRSLLTGVSGAKAHQKKLDVVGNNIANVNTTGFKKSSVVFQDLLSQTESGAMAPDGNVGGVNAKQVGLGVQVGAIETLHTQGPISYTGNRTDMAIQGEGYYVVRNGNENLYTRAGNFVLDDNSDLVMSGTGYRIQGNEVTLDEMGNEVYGSDLKDINIPLGRKMEANATSTVGYRCNLDSRVGSYLPLGIPEGVSFSAELLGTEYTVDIAEGEEVSDFINIRLTNDADGTVETLKFAFGGVQQSSGDESIYYPKLELVGTSSHAIEYDATKGTMSIDGTTVPMSAYMNYQAISMDDSTGTSHTYLAEITEVGNKAQVRLWGEGKDEATGASQVDYFQWNVLKTEDGLFDPDSTLKMTTGEDSEFPDPISLFLEVDSSGKALNFRGNVSPIIGPATSNSVVNKYGNTAKIGLDAGTTSIYDITVGTDSITVDSSFSKTTVGMGDTFSLDFTSISDKNGTSTSASDSLSLRCAGIDESGNGLFQWTSDGGSTWNDFASEGGADPTVSLRHFTGTGTPVVTTAADGDYTLSYNATTGAFSVTPPASSYLPSATPPTAIGYIEDFQSQVYSTAFSTMATNGNNAVGLKTPETYTDPTATGGAFSIGYDLPDSVSVGEEIELELTTTATTTPATPAKTATVDLKCVSINSAGNAVFQWSDDGGTTWKDFAVNGGSDPEISGLDYYDSTAPAWKTSGGTNPFYTLGYDATTGSFVVGGDIGMDNPDLSASTKMNLETSISGLGADLGGSGVDWSVNAELPSTVSVGEEIELKLTNSISDGTSPDLDRILKLKCTGFDATTGAPIFQYDAGAGTWTDFASTGGTDPNLANMYYYDGTDWKVSDGSADMASLSYASGVFTFNVEDGTAAPAAHATSVALASISGSRIFHEPTDFQVPAEVSIGYGFKEGDTVDDFLTLTLDYPDSSGISGATQSIDLAFKGVSEDGNVILRPSPSTIQLPVADPDDPDALTLADHEVVYNSESGTVSLVNSSTGKTTWAYSDFKFQTTEINGANYLVDYDGSGPADTTYGNVVTLWGANELGTITSFRIDTTEVGSGLTYSNVDGDVTYGGSQAFSDKFAGGATVTVKPSPTDSSKLIFTYDGTDGGSAVASVRENSESVHEGKGTIYDSLGNEHTLEVVWKKVGNNTWSWEAFLPEEPDITLSDNKGVIRFTSEGKLLSGGENTISIGFSAIGADDSDIVLDFSGKSFDKEEIEGVTQYGSAFTTKPYYQDGYGMGVLKDFSVSSDGTIVGTYDNGQNQSLYKVSLALFSNPQGLLKSGDTCFSASINSGEPSIVNAMVDGAGTIAGGALEGSNVDITEEFTDLITTQRGFQASARVITTSDSVLEELLNLKR